MSSQAELLLESIYLWPSHLPTENFGKADYVELANLLAGFRPPNRTPNVDVGIILFEGIVEHGIMPSDMKEPAVLAWAYSQFMHKRLTVAWLNKYGTFYNKMTAPIITQNQKAFEDISARFSEDMLPVLRE